MYASYQQGSGIQSVFQPGFAGTNPQQVRQQIAQEGGFASGIYGQTQQAAYGVPVQTALGGAQAIFQPGFAGTNPQLVRQQIAQEGGFSSNYPQAQQTYNNVQSFQAGLSGVQAIFQPGFAGTNPQEVRQEIAQEGGFSSHYAQPAQQTAYLQPAYGVQAIFQPGFAGTNPQQVRQQIAQEGGFLSNVAQPQQTVYSGQQLSQVGLGGVQAIFQPGFAGTNPQQVRQQIAQEGGFSSNIYGQPQQTFRPIQGIQAYQPGFVQ